MRGEFRDLFPGAQIAGDDHRPFPAHSPNCGECVPCLKTLLFSARKWRDRNEEIARAAQGELMRTRGRLREIADELTAA